ncbi:hypothetical protein GCM10023215_07860 [Pseudonocardia yuanmonensis]|uniref:DUF3040 domain-containing protein n=1 Tax=Pseudonocardia yuanmonensis TaxID=1095914 RepID=A0ABP8W054_9PSEU
MTEREKKVLAELGAELQADDPSLGAELSRPPATRSPTRMKVDRVVQALAVLAMVLVLVPADWFGLVLALVLMVGLPLLVLLWVDPTLRPRAARSRRNDDSHPQEGQG